jgi:Flp pilus assembly pilin Flp
LGFLAAGMNRVPAASEFLAVNPRQASAIRQDAVGSHNNIPGGYMKHALRRLWQDEEGQDLTEYALLLVLIALVCISSMNTLAGAISDVFSNAAGNLSTS